MGTEYGKYNTWEQRTENIVHRNRVRKIQFIGTEYGKYSTWEQRTEKREGRRAKYREESFQNEVREKKLGEEGLMRRGKPGEQSSKKQKEVQKMANIKHSTTTKYGH